MRFMLQLLTLLALLVAPLAAPVAAMTTHPVASDCSGMKPDHKMPAGDYHSGVACCVAVPAAIDPSLNMAIAAPPCGHPTFISIAQAFLLGAGPAVEDPPPRVA